MARFWKSMSIEKIVVAIFDNYNLPQESTGLSYGSVALRLSLRKCRVAYELMGKVKDRFITYI